MNRKARKKRKMQLKRQGMEIFKPHWNDIIIQQGHEIRTGKMKNCEFMRLIYKPTKEI